MSARMRYKVFFDYESLVRFAVILVPLLLAVAVLAVAVGGAARAHAARCESLHARCVDVVPTAAVQKR